MKSHALTIATAPVGRIRSTWSLRLHFPQKVPGSVQSPPLAQSPHPHRKHTAQIFDYHNCKFEDGSAGLEAQTVGLGVASPRAGFIGATTCEQILSNFPNSLGEVHYQVFFPDGQTEMERK